MTNKTVVIFGGEGAIGSAIAHAFRAAGADVHAVGHARADVLDERAVAAVADELREIDVALSAAAFPYRGGPLADRTVDELLHPIERMLRANLTVARAVAPHMRPGGTILTLSTAGARFARPGNLGFGTACAAVEQLTQRLAAELGPSGVRVVCLRPHAIPGTPLTTRVFGASAAATLAGNTLLGRLPTLQQVADTAVFLASDRAAAITGAVIDVSCGSALRAHQFDQVAIGVLD